MALFKKNTGHYPLPHLKTLWKKKMKHGLKLRKLGRDSAHRRALLRNLTTQLIRHERIMTTYAKAMELRKPADRVREFSFLLPFDHFR